MNKPLVIDYYSDILCVWAWIAQRRIDELKQGFGDALEFRYRYVDLLQARIYDGSAIAALMNDYQICKLQTIKGSPSYVIDGGRQVLYGNVGYRMLHANIEELAKNPPEEASWC